MSNLENEDWPTPKIVKEIAARAGGQSSLGLVLGSGLGPIADRLENRRTISSTEIPGYPESTVTGHQGKLHFGTWAGRSLWVVQGRVHTYEGLAPRIATRYVRLLRALGVDTLVLTNAAGSVDSTVGPGEIVVDRDALNLFFRPLAPAELEPTFQGRDRWRPRGPLSDPDLVVLAEETARQLRIPLRNGILVGSTGPNYETAAEVRAWRKLGGTVASMSTVPEAVQARELGMRTLVFSLVTNYGTGISRTALSHDEVVEVADQAGNRLAGLIEGVVSRLEPDR